MVSRTSEAAKLGDADESLDIKSSVRHFQTSHDINLRSISK
jgi:hypothetical protein